MPTRRAQRRRIVIAVAAAALATASATGLPLLTQHARATDVAAVSINPAARAAAEFAPSRSGQRSDVAHLAAERRAELQPATAANAGTSAAAAQRNADLSAVRTQVADAAIQRAVDALLDSRRAQEEDRRAGKPVGGETMGAAAVLALSPGSSDRTTTPVPAGQYTLTARFGQTGLWFPYHMGLDLAGPVGTPIVAATDGVVGYSLSDDWAGINVVVYHGDGSSAIYAHLSASMVQPGQVVHAGDRIGSMGNTGRSFGSHLHFEVAPNGAVPGDSIKAVNPETWLAGRGAPA